MSSYVGSSQASIASWQKKKYKPGPAEVVLSLVQQYALPLVAAGWALKRFLAYRKAQAAKKPTAAAEAAAKKAEPAAARKPRREYKVKRDQDGPMLVGADDAEVEVQPHDDVVEGYHETEVEAAGNVAAGPGGGNTQMLQMLQQMGYRIVMPKDGSGQAFLVPPGAKVPGEAGIEEGGWGACSVLGRGGGRGGG